MEPSIWLVDDPDFDAHSAGAYHPERPERLRAARQGVRGAGVALRPVPARVATNAELERVHDAAYLESLEGWRGKTGFLDPDTYVAPGSVDIARKAAGGAIALTEQLLRGEPCSGIALLRPPGHHARPGSAMGFCLLNNVAVAAAHARSLGVERVLVVDWDVHHGNGTEEMFWSDPHVLYMSLHQSPFYPGTGAVTDRGAGEGTGYTLNVPLAAGADDSVIRSVFERILLPAAEAYAPQLVLVSAGFDASERDPLAEMRLSDVAFGWMAARLAEVAKRSASSRMGLFLEGGYDLVALERGVLAAVRGMVDPRAAFDLPIPAPHADVEHAYRAASAYWKLG